MHEGEEGVRGRREVLAAAAMSFAAAPARAGQSMVVWPSALTMATGSPGGTYAVFGPAWGAIVAAATHVHLLYRATDGPNENILLLDRGAADLAMTTLGIAHEAWTGGGAWTGGIEFRTIRALFPLYETAFHGFAPARSTIRAVTALDGCVLGVGPEYGTGGTYVPRMLQLLGIKVAGFRFDSYSALADALGSGRVDACLIAAGPPVPAFRDLARGMPIRCFGFSPPDIQLLVRDLPALSQTRIPPGTYPGQTTAIPCPGMFNFAICRARLPRSLVYALTAAVMARVPELVAKLPLASEMQPRNIALNRFLPFHPGAAEYFRRGGFFVPDRLVRE